MTNNEDNQAINAKDIQVSQTLEQWLTSFEHRLNERIDLRFESLQTGITINRSLSILGVAVLSLIKYLN